MNSLNKNDVIRARKLCNLFKFTDALNLINDGEEFETKIKDIYLEELQLNKESSNKNFSRRQIYSQDKAKDAQEMLSLKV